MSRSNTQTIRSIYLVSITSRYTNQDDEGIILIMPKHLVHKNRSPQSDRMSCTRTIQSSKSHSHRPGSMLDAAGSTAAPLAICPLASKNAGGTPKVAVLAGVLGVADCLVCQVTDDDPLRPPRISRALQWIYTRSTRTHWPH